MAGEAWMRCLFDASWQGAALLAVAGVVAFGARQAAAATRHLCHGLGLLGLLLTFALAPLTPRWQVLPLTPATPATAIQSAVAPAAVTPAGAAAVAAPSLVRPVAHEGAALPTTAVGEPVAAEVGSAEPAPSIAEPAWSWQAVVLSLWALGAFVALLPLAIGLLRARRIVRRSRPLDAARRGRLAALVGEERAFAAVRWATTSAVAAPITLGWLRPTVLLPEGFANWDVGTRRIALRHELAHVRRRDWLTRLAARCAVALHWWNPLAWWTERQLRIASECACDDAVVEAGVPAWDCAAGLVAVARLLRVPALPTIALGMAGGSQLERRVTALLDGARPRRGIGRGARLLAIGVALAAMVACAGAAVFRPVGAVLVVDPRGGAGQYATIQAAIDAAKPGDRVQVAAGEYHERLAIEKPLVLEGAGAATTKVWCEYVGANEPSPTLVIRAARGVTVRGCKFAAPGAGVEGGVAPGAIVAIEDAGAVLEGCAIVGSPASGLVIRGASDVAVRGCLVAGSSATGIAVASATAGVTIEDCDIRFCNHRGITITRGNATTTVARCRISGSGWHGIRYDDASPTVTGNVFFAIQRSGIYASGKTAGKITDNLFLARGMAGEAQGGISCWFEAQDEIVGNTFVGPFREAVAVLGAAAPKIRRNVFAEVDQAIRLGNIADGEADARRIATGALDCVGNAFWQVATPGSWAKVGSKEPVVLALLGDQGNREIDPQFADASQGDWSLAPQSPLRVLQAGAARPLGLASPWSTQDEERPYLPQQPAVVAAQPPHDEAASQRAASAWLVALRQIDSKERREAAVREIAAALASGTRDQQTAALIALSRTGDVAFDRAPFAPLVRPLCAGDDDQTVTQALYALHAVGATPDDRTILFAALRAHPQVLRDSGTHLLVQYCDRQLTGEAGELALAALAGADRRSRRSAMSGLWGAAASAELQARLLELANDPAERHDAIYFGLSTLANKNREVVQFLVGLLSDPGEVDRALWGLGQGIAPSEHGLVADAALRLFAARIDARVQTSCLRLLEACGGRAQVAGLRELAANELLPPELRERVGKLAEVLATR